ncbi:MAG: DUF547 domain-containing protein [Candidatus Eisenbacteria bacterium]
MSPRHSVDAAVVHHSIRFAAALGTMRRPRIEATPMCPRFQAMVLPVVGVAALALGGLTGVAYGAGDVVAAEALHASAVRAEAPQTDATGADARHADTPQSDAVRADALHAHFGVLLERYVHGFGVDYPGWAGSETDLARLDDYVHSLTALDPKGWPSDDRKVYWINLYNAATLRLVLANYPVDSIKDIGGLFSSPWKRDVVTVAGSPLTLDAIENEILRPEFHDPRVHFALNCASIGCPPLLAGAYHAAQIGEQLDKSCRRTLNDDRWVRADTDGIRVTKIFDWYKGDFDEGGGSVRAFIDRYRRTPLPSGKIEFLSYDWSLNVTR